MARLNCPDCPKTFKGEGGLTWHRKHNHQAGSSTSGGAAALASMDAAGESGEVAQPAAQQTMTAGVDPVSECPSCIHNSDARAQAVADLAVVQAKLTNERTRREALEGQIANLQQTPVHPPGLCGDDACAPCVAQAQIIADTAVQQAITTGRHAALTDVHQALLWAGGNALANRIAQLAQVWVQRGKPAPAREPTLVILKD